MIIRRTTFFLWLFIIVIAPFFLYKILWLVRTEKTNGIMSFVGKSYSGQIVHIYSVITFVADKDTIWFNGTDNMIFHRGEIVPVRYLKNNPSEARIDLFPGIWGDTLVYGGIPLIILVIVFLHPEIIPHRSKIRLRAKRPFIEIV